MLIFVYFDSSKQRELLLSKKKGKLLEIASALEDKMDTSFDSILISENATKLTKNQQVQILNKHLQPLIMDTAKHYPGYSMGYYCRKLDCIVAVGPKLNHDLLGKTVKNQPILRLYKTDHLQTGYAKGVTRNGNPNIILVNLPIHNEGKLIGHTWANSKIDDIYRDFYLSLLKSLLIIFLIWLTVISIIGWAFKKLETNLQDLSLQIANNQDNPNSFKDFPELLPVLQTVTQLRNKLKAETIQCENEVQKLNQLIDLCPIYITVIDDQEQIVKINKAFRDFLNGSGLKENLIGKHVRVISDFFGIDYNETRIIHALKGVEGDNYPQIEGLTFICNAVPIKDTQTNKNIGAIAVYSDITEYEKMREEITRLDRLNIVSQMAATLAHEIRNPMSAIRGYVQLLMRKLNNEHSKYFYIILDELDRANSTITDFLSFARNKDTEKKQEILNDLISEIYPLFYGEAVNKEIKVKLDLANNLPSININGKEIKQIILNLARNSIEAINKCGILTIETKSLGEEVQLVVSDTGCGIPKEKLDKIFSPFYTDKDNGTGLGLSVCLNIIEKHQGNITVESKEGVGTTFTITFSNKTTNQENKVG